MEFDVEPKVLTCRHCGAKNRINPGKVLQKMNKVRCGSCSRSVFFPEREPLVGLPSTAYEHPLDRNALRMLKKVPGIQSILKFIVRELSDRRLKMLHQQAYLKAGPDHLKPLHAMVIQGCDVLDLDRTPELYVMQSSEVNAYAVGVDEPFVVVTTGLLDVLDDRQILGVIAHELGHIKAGHQLYRTASYLLANLAGRILSRLIPFRGAAVGAISQALAYWSRCSELTADRAQMLVQRDFESYVKCEMKLAGGCRYTNHMLDAEAFLRQADEAVAMQNENWFNKIYANMQVADQSHPFPVWRAGHMKEWVLNGQFMEIVSGTWEVEEPEPIEEDSSSGKDPKEVRDLLEDLKRKLDDD